MSQNNAFRQCLISLCVILIRNTYIPSLSSSIVILILNNRKLGEKQSSTVLNHPLDIFMSYLHGKLYYSRILKQIFSLLYILILGMLALYLPFYGTLDDMCMINLFEHAYTNY